MDVLSETLGAMKITGNVLLNEAYSAPWAVSVPDKTALTQSFDINKNIPIAAFHLVQRG